MLPLGFCRQAAKQKADPVESFSVNSVNNMDAAAAGWVEPSQNTWWERVWDDFTIRAVLWGLSAYVATKGIGLSLGVTVVVVSHP